MAYVMKLAYQAAIQEYHRTLEEEQWPQLPARPL